MAHSATVKEIAEKFNISPTTIRRYVAEGRISARRLGPKLIRLDPAQVEQELFGPRSA